MIIGLSSVGIQKFGELPNLVRILIGQGGRVSHKNMIYPHG